MLQRFEELIEIKWMDTVGLASRQTEISKMEQAVDRDCQ